MARRVFFPYRMGREGGMEGVRACGRRLTGGLDHIDVFSPLVGRLHARQLQVFLTLLAS